MVGSIPSELDLISFIKSLQRPDEAGEVGIGDDAAVIASFPAGYVIATDMILEGRHFDLSVHPLELAGRKAIAVNLSDIAAMGAIPRFALVSLALPEGFGLDRARRLWRGLQRLADQFGVKVIGGDTNSWEGKLAVNVCVIGVPPDAGAVLRNGARPGDGIYVTGALGGSFLSGHHLTFEPRVREAAEILRAGRPTAMMDITDGLATDLRHICRASGVGAALDSAAIPVAGRVDPALPRSERLVRALTDGEDFELVFTGPSHVFDHASFSFPVVKVGTVIETPGILIDGIETDIAGFQHRF